MKPRASRNKGRLSKRTSFVREIVKDKLSYFVQTRERLSSEKPIANLEHRRLPVSLPVLRPSIRDSRRSVICDGIPMPPELEIIAVVST